MYSVPAYGKMIADGPRVAGYLAALSKVVTKDSVVIDLGCGPGFFALMACRFGARRVFAIDADNVIQVGRDAALELGFADRIEFIQEFSTKVDLPERADVIISDLHGVLPWLRHHIPSIVDARSRFLAPGGVLIPHRDLLWAGLVEAPVQYATVVGPWEGDDSRVGLSAGRNLAVNLWSKIRVEPAELLGQPVCWHVLDFREVEEVNVCGEIALPAERGGTAHGFVVWFDAEMFGETGFTNAPGQPELIYGNAFYPFREPLQLAAGDRVDVRLDAQLIGDDYAWRWDTSLNGQRRFTQSTLLGAPLSVASLRKRANTYIPKRTQEGSIVSFVLSLMDGRNSNEQIAAQLLIEFPQRFRTENDALDTVVTVTDKYAG